MILALKKTVCKNSHAAVIFFGLFSWSRNLEEKNILYFVCFVMLTICTYIYMKYFSLLCHFQLGTPGIFQLTILFAFCFSLNLLIENTIFSSTLLQKTSN